jgi:hypothetical protein
VTALAVALVLGAGAFVVALQPADRPSIVPLAAAMASAAEEAVETPEVGVDPPSVDALASSTEDVSPAEEAAVALTMTHVDAVGPDAEVSRPDPAPSRAEAEPRSSGLARTRSGWICEDAVRLSDARGGRWSVDSVSFRDMNGYERVILHLDREGGSGSRASAAGEAFATSAIRSFAPMAARPGAGRTTIGIELAGGIRSGLDLRAFRPQGLQTIRELSIYRAGPEARVLISVASDGCFRMRAPAWQGGAASPATSAQLVVDVRS